MNKTPRYRPTGAALLHGVLATMALLASSPQGIADDSPRERLSFNDGWRFTKGDPPEVQGSLDYSKVKEWVTPAGADLVGFAPARTARPAGNLGEGVSYARPDFVGGVWRSVRLPHDWGIEGPFSQDLSGETGKLPWAGVGWYRKTFTSPREDGGRRVYLDVDGAMAYSLVWLNGSFVGGWPYGYSSWRLDLTPYLKPGAENVLAIRLDNPPDSSRWYPGAGIYRNVWLVKTGPVHVAHWGSFVTTPKVDRDAATVEVHVVVDNVTAEPAKVRVATRLFEADAMGRKVGDPLVTGAALALSIAKNSSSHLAQSLVLSHPKVWGLTSTQRYVAETVVTRADEVLDSYEVPFGVRTIAFTADRGFLLNGERVQLRGVCNHHDLGALGAALNLRALERQLELLRSMGVNAIRTSHNPPAPELLDLCDRLGLVVMVEAFDCWHAGKKANDYHLLFDDWHEKDLRAMVRRDRNHPSVVMWSIGNEIIEQSQPGGWKLATHLAGLARQEDRTRPVVAGFNHLESGYNGFQTAVDVAGYNYKPTEYGPFRERNPLIPLIGSETSSCVSSRGEYFFPVGNDKAGGLSDFQMSSYDLYAPRWAFPPDTEFKGLDEAPFVAGEFVWTGFDYLGEPTPYGGDSETMLDSTDPAQRERMKKELAEIGRIRVPSRSSYFGIIDLAGFPKDRFYNYQARWRPELPMAHILPHWNWPERVGQVTPVFVYSSGDEAELFLNGRSLGRKHRGPLEYRFRWDDVVYQPGELRVATYKDGQPWAEAVQRTTGPAKRLMLAADRPTFLADGSDLSFVTVTIADKQGQLVPRSKNRIRFSITGPGEIVAVDNGDATSHESFQAKERAAYNGLALVVVRGVAGRPGIVTLRAEAVGLAPAEVRLTTTH